MNEAATLAYKRSLSGLNVFFLTNSCVRGIIMSFSPEVLHFLSENEVQVFLSSEKP